MGGSPPFFCLHVFSSRHLGVFLGLPSTDRVRVHGHAVQCLEAMLMHFLIAFKNASSILQGPDYATMINEHSLKLLSLIFFPLIYLLCLQTSNPDCHEDGMEEGHAMFP